jgi:SNF2 family DNA or RNA helicase
VFDRREVNEAGSGSGSASSRVEYLVRLSSQRTEDEPVWRVVPKLDGLPPLPPALLRRLRPHQLEGVRFMLDNITGSNNAGRPRGCLLADSMGLVPSRALLC